MDKLDLVKADKQYYNPPTKPTLIELPPYNYVAIEGRGEPGGPVHASSTEAQYTVAYAVKFACKMLGHDFAVPKQEGLWWFDEGETRAAADVPRSDWNWRLLIRMPDFVTPDIFAQAKEKAIAKKPALAQINNVTFHTLHEDKAVQMMHIGPFVTEPETQATLEQFMHENELKHNGHHHEIYVSDWRKADPNKLKTVLRYPVK